MLCSKTNGALPAVHIDDEIIRLATELAPIIDEASKLAPELDITLRMQHGWIASVGFAFRAIRQKVKRTAH